MTRRDDTRLSRFFSLVLRHQPDSIGLVLDAQGWASIEDLIRKGNLRGRSFDRKDVLRIVETNDKKRFVVSPDGQRIRAAQGHSIDIDLGLEPQQPPDQLFHGTAERFLESVLANGLHAGSRQHVHLSLDEETARTVGSRHGNPVVLTVQTGLMHEEGHEFFRSENGVWLTAEEPPRFVGLSDLDR